MTHTPKPDTKPLESDEDLPPRAMLGKAMVEKHLENYTWTDEDEDEYLGELYEAKLKKDD